MVYADSAYYKNKFGGNIIPDEDLNSKLSRASDQIDNLTYNRISTKGFDNLTEFQKDKVRKAVCYQADFITQYGDYINLPVSSYSIGETSLNFDSNIVNGISTTKEVLNYLSQTGLNSRRL